MTKEIDDKQIAAIFKIRNDAQRCLTFPIEKLKEKDLSETYTAYYKGREKVASEILYLLDLSR